RAADGGPARRPRWDHDVRRWYGDRPGPCPARPSWPLALAAGPVAPPRAAGTACPARGRPRGVRLCARGRGPVQPRGPGRSGHSRGRAGAHRLGPPPAAGPAARGTRPDRDVVLGDLPGGVLRVGGVRLPGQLLAVAPVVHRPDRAPHGAAPDQERGDPGVAAGRLGPGEAVGVPPLPTRGITIAGFVVVVAAMIVLEILARRPGSRIPTLGQWLGYLVPPRIRPIPGLAA